MILSMVCTAGWNGNQVVGGLLMQTTQNTVSKTCDRRFSKFQTKCTYTATVYDDATGEVVVNPMASTGGLSPYGVDAVFLQDSPVYDSSLSIGESFAQPCAGCPHEVEAMFLQDPTCVYNSRLITVGPLADLTIDLWYLLSVCTVTYTGTHSCYVQYIWMCMPSWC